MDKKLQGFKNDFRNWLIEIDKGSSYVGAANFTIDSGWVGGNPLTLFFVMKLGIPAKVYYKVVEYPTGVFNALPDWAIEFNKRVAYNANLDVSLSRLGSLTLAPRVILDIFDNLDDDGKYWDGRYGDRLDAIFNNDVVAYLKETRKNES